ncbi:MAG: alpha/beta fold hydrolase [Acidobacteria bacterium]|nr:alpha/beta fold hydrolase [Acidobacteriota bacterium]MBM3758431.1 alpha/beta fold hydrolase [Acidobacteriota bacterium]
MRALATLAFSTLAIHAEVFYADKSHLLHSIDSSGARREIKGKGEWQRTRRQHILANMQAVMGPLPAKSNAPLDVQVIEEVKSEKFTRRKITFVSEGQDRVPAYVFLPNAKGRRPAMLCLHQTTRVGKAEPAGVDGKANLHYARELAERGFVTIAPDYPNYGDYKFDPYAAGYVSATMKGIVNHRRAVDVLVAMANVDAKRIGVIGHSLGGHNSLFVAVFDDRLRAVVTSCGFNAFPKYFNGNLKGWSHRGYMPRIAELYAMNPAKMPFDFTEILGVIAPRAVFINAPTGDANFDVSGVHDCVRAASPIYKMYGKSANLVAVHPDAQHDFPPAIREQAYEFLTRVLR